MDRWCPPGSAIFTLSLTAPTRLGMSLTENEDENCSFSAWTKSCWRALR